MKAVQFYGHKDSSPYSSSRGSGSNTTPKQTTQDSGSETDSDFETPKEKKPKKIEVMEIDISDDEEKKQKQEQQQQKSRTKLWLTTVTQTTNKIFTSKNNKIPGIESSVSSIKSSTSKMSKMGAPRRARSPARTTSSLSSRSRGPSVAALARQNPGQSSSTTKNSNGYSPLPLTRSKISPPATSPSKDTESQVDSQSDFYKSLIESSAHSPSTSLRSRGDKSSLINDGSLISNFRNRKNTSSSNSNNSNNNNNDIYSFNDSTKSPERLLGKSKTVAAGSNVSQDSNSIKEEDDDDKLLSQKYPQRQREEFIFKSEITSSPDQSSKSTATFATMPIKEEKEMFDKSFSQSHSQTSSTSNRLNKTSGTDSQREQKYRQRQREEINIKNETTTSPNLSSKSTSSLATSRVKKEKKMSDDDSIFINDSIHREIKRIALRCERNKIINLEKLTFENLLGHFSKKYSNIRDGANKNKLPWETLGVLAEFLKKEETFSKIMEELDKIRGDVNLLENKSTDELFDLVMKNMQDFVQEEFRKLSRGWSGCMYLFSV